MSFRTGLRSGGRVRCRPWRMCRSCRREQTERAVARILGVR